MCENCTVLSAEVERLDRHLKLVVKSTSRVVTAHQERVAQLEAILGSFMQLSNGSIDSLTYMIEELRMDVSYLNEKMTNPFGGVPIGGKDRLVH